MRAFTAVALVAVSAERMTGCPFEASTPVDVEVRVAFVFPDGPGRTDLDLVGCRDWDRQIGRGSLWARPGRDACAVVGVRQDQGLRVRSTPVQVDPREREATISFDLPSGELGWIGAEVALETRIRCVPDPGSAIGQACSPVEVARITKVVRPGPAAQAGLVAGDAILSVDGTSIATLAGPPGPLRGRAGRDQVRLAAVELRLIGRVGESVLLEVEDAHGSELAPRRVARVRPTSRTP